MPPPPTAIPVTVTPEAAARVAELGLQRELEEMVQHTLETIPSLRSVEVVLELPYDTGDDIRIAIRATAHLDAAGMSQAKQQWRAWVVETYPSRVLAYINLTTVRGTAS
jgi:hypothetical protein